MQHSQTSIFVAADGGSVLVKADSNGARPHAMPPPDPTNTATVLRSTSHSGAHVRFGSGIAGEATAIAGVIFIPAHSSLLLKGAAAEAAAMATEVFVQDFQAALEVVRGRVETQELFAA